MNPTNLFPHEPPAFAAHGVLSTQVKALLQKWEHKLSSLVVLGEAAENSLHFSADLSSIRLRGMENVTCLLLRGDRAAATQAFQHFWQTTGVAGRIPFIFALSDSAYQAAHELLVGRICLLLNAERPSTMLEAPDAQKVLKQYLQIQIPRRRLNPYGITQPVIGAMFFGRGVEMAQLVEDAETSFAIAGPSRIGKSSLMLQYKYRMIQTKDPRAAHTFYIDFYECQLGSDDEMARFVAMQIAASSRSARMTNADLVNFLHYQATKAGRPLDLLLDEVDLVCGSKVFECLGLAMRKGYCRLVLSGRGELLKLMLSTKSSVASRLRLFRLQPLDQPTARELFTQPLNDLGVHLQEPDKSIEQVLHATGRFPHLLQYFGARVVELSVREGSDQVTVVQINKIIEDFETAQFFIAPLQDLRGTEAYLLALKLIECGKSDFDLAFVHRVAEQAGFVLDHPQLVTICNDLVISNILVWDNSILRIANEGLRKYAHQLGYLNDAQEVFVDI